MSKNLKKLVAIAVAVVSVCSFSMINVKSTTNVIASEGKSSKNAIVMIADGMTTELITLARHVNGGSLNMDKISVGSAKTTWSEGPITDSAPGATALSTGQKTLNKYVGTSKEDKPLATILEVAEQNGKATGLIATAEIPHATPAGFSSHTTSRSRYADILRQMVNNDLEVVLGGGFNLKTDELTAEIEGRINEAGYEYVNDKSEMLNYDGEKLWGAFAKADLDYDIDREESGNNQPSIAEMTNKAIEVLNKDEDGFFLMVEGSKVDWAAHDNGAAAMVSDVLAFDKAVGDALKFVESNQETVLVVTTDHGNSGLTIGNEESNESNITYDMLNKINDFKVTEKYFNNSILKNLKSDEEIKASVAENFGISDLTSEDIALIKAENIKKVLANRSGVGFTTTGHTGEDVYLGFYAPSGVEKLGGTIDNTDIPKYLSKVLFKNENILSETTEELYIDGKEALEEIGAKVSLDLTNDNNRKAIIEKDNNIIELELFTNDYTLNGEKKSLDSIVPYIYTEDGEVGNMYIPSELIEEVKNLKPLEKANKEEIKEEVTN